ncbi:MAG TPA: helix-turn-helix domain-containing protein [Candidatus Limnocylindrales bacterium]|nr:helix-turn-helix domain-containing protein [Candidatus Limnocylindrales bacterium]
MSRNKDRQRAIVLRQSGKTYGEIRAELNVSKGTLSGWLQDYPLTENQLVLLKTSVDKRRYLAREKTSITKQVNRQNKLDIIYLQQQKEYLTLSKRELFLAGLFLYWGEGGKTEKGMLSISNTDPGVLKFSLYWIIKSLDVPKDKIQVRLHLYDDMIIEEAVDYWSKMLNIEKKQFAKPYIKKSTREGLSYKGYGHGTCMLRVYDTRLKERILMSIKAMADYPDISDL